MPICPDAVRDLVRLVGDDYAGKIVRAARRQDVIESKWNAALDKFLKDLNKKSASDLINRGKVSHIGYDFEEFFMNHYAGVVLQSIKDAGKITPINKARLSGPPKTLKGLQQAWDRWRKKKKLPAGLQKSVDKIKSLYLKKVNDVWKKQSADFREGGEYNQESVVRSLTEATKMPTARAKTIVQTATTRYYNEARREYFNDPEIIPAWLFMSVRDQRRTKWCKTRHGLIYFSDDDLRLKEEPDIHWNCRSEMIPLTSANPRHQTLIQDKSRWRRNNSCEPLPPNYTKT